MPTKTQLGIAGLCPGHLRAQLTAYFLSSLSDLGAPCIWAGISRLTWSWLTSGLCYHVPCQLCHLSNVYSGSPVPWSRGTGSTWLILFVYILNTPGLKPLLLMQYYYYILIPSSFFSDRIGATCWLADLTWEGLCFSLVDHDWNFSNWGVPTQKPPHSSWNIVQNYIIFACFQFHLLFHWKFIGQVAIWIPIQTIHDSSTLSRLPAKCHTPFDAGPGEYLSFIHTWCI